MSLLLNLFLSMFVHLFFLFLVAKGLTGDWHIYLKESLYLVLTGLLLSLVRVFILQFNFPNLSAHLFSSANFLMILFLYFPALFSYFYKVKLYSAKNAVSYTATTVSIALLSDFFIDLTSIGFFPSIRLHWTMTLTEYPIPVIFHLLFHCAVALGFTVLFIDATQNLRSAIQSDKRIQTVCLCVSAAVLVLTTAALFVFYLHEESISHEAWSRNIPVTFAIIYILLAGSLLHTKFLEQKHKQQRQDAQYEDLKYYADELEKQYTAMRKFKHDYQNILTSMDSFFRASDWVGLRQYYSRSIKPASEVITKGNFALEALRKVKVIEVKSILAVKLLTAQNMSMAINTTFEAPDEINSIPIDSVSLVRMLGIILDNAIEELVSLSGGKLSVACFHSGESLTFVVQNTCRPDIPKLHRLKQAGFSSKGRDRGHGLSILAEIEASRPNVTLSTTIEAGTFTQQVTINGQ